MQECCAGRPILLPGSCVGTSFVAAVGLEDYEAALHAAEIGMRASPGDGGFKTTPPLPQLNLADSMKPKRISRRQE